MLVKEYMLGNTKIKIFDDAYAKKSPNEITEIIRRIEKLGYKAFTMCDDDKDRNAL